LILQGSFAGPPKSLGNIYVTPSIINVNANYCTPTILILQGPFAGPPKSLGDIYVTPAILNIIDVNANYINNFQTP
jgi:hypothetical protein